MKKKRFDEDIWLISKTYSGSSCDLYLAFWPEEDEQVIIKAIKPELEVKEKLKIEERLLKEASTLEEFWNKSFPKVYDIRRRKENDQLYLILEHFPGNSLRDFFHINFEKKLSFSFLENFLKQMQSILVYLHDKKNLCHLDLTPENIIITEDDQVKVIDFEESKVIGQKVTTEHLRGKVNYLPPEFMHPKQHMLYSGASDIYTFGIMLKEIFEKTKGLKPSQKRYFLNIIRHCTSKRAEARPKASHLLDLPTQSVLLNLYHVQQKT